MTEPLSDCDLPPTREAAAQAGSRRYFSGIACPAGHVVARYTQNGYCVECQRLTNQQDRQRMRALLKGGA